MPIPIEETGGFLALDAEGYVVNEASVSKIALSWDTVLAEVTAACVREYGPKLHSVYVRGSARRLTARLLAPVWKSRTAGAPPHLDA